MPRRGHKKSRAGCADCKRRHVKCDETRPSCVNCNVASLTCSYAKSAQSVVSVSRSPVTTPSISPLTPHATGLVNVRQDEMSDRVRLDNTINFDHMELLHHYVTVTLHAFTIHSDVAVRYRETAVRNALRFPFLMYAILALSALHLCRTRPERSGHYLSLASSLQAEGLKQLRDTLLNINTENCVAAFIFSTTTGLHSFCDTFTFHSSNFNEFLEKLTSTIHLMRGVRSVMDGGWWEYLHTTELSEILANGAVLGGSDVVVDRTKETKPLWELLTVADIGPASYKAYEDSVHTLQKIFDADTKLENAETSVSMVFAWPVMISFEYNDLLKQRRPEALVILAYYGIILHKRRAAWAVGDSGRFLIHAISDYLGKHWDRWLQWPKTFTTSTATTVATDTPD